MAREVRVFPTTTSGLLALSEWLTEADHRDKARVAQRLIKRLADLGPKVEVHAPA